jgi:hypothetical protein
MARPHIEFVQCQNIPWRKEAHGVEVKMLNTDPETTEATLIRRVPPGWSQRWEDTDPAQELFLLDGALEVNGRRHDRHSYLFRPKGGPGATASSPEGASLLIFRYAEDDPDACSSAAPPIEISTPAMAWDVSVYDPALIHLRLARKVLRMGPNDSGRTFLLAGLPHGVPEASHMPAETHRHCEEMFMIHGEMFAPEGVMRAGAYFFRPPGILHGPHCSETGFFQIMRSPGANWIKTDWSDEMRPLPAGAVHAPVIPSGAPDVWSLPWDPGPRY